MNEYTKKNLLTFLVNKTPSAKRKKTDLDILFNGIHDDFF